MHCFGLFVHLAQPYNAEFYYDTPNPIRTLKNNYSYILQWTQKEPGAVDKIIGYWINVQQVKQTPTYTGSFIFTASFFLSFFLGSVGGGWVE